MLLLLLWRAEALHISQVKNIAQASALESGSSASGSTQMMAGLGTSSGNNLQRDFDRRIAKPMRTYVRPTFVDVPWKNINTDVNSMVPWPILPPHRVLAMMFKTGLMSKLMLGGIDLRRYWEVFALEHPNHPGVLLARSGVLPIPVRLHGDEGQIQRKEQLMLLSFCGFFHGAVLDSRFVSAVFPSRHYVYDSEKVCQSLVSIHGFLVWS